MKSVWDKIKNMNNLIPLIIFFVSAIVQYQMICDKMNYIGEEVKVLRIKNDEKLDKDQYEKDQREMVLQFEHLNVSVDKIGYYLLESQTYKNRVKS